MLFWKVTSNNWEANHKVELARCCLKATAQTTSAEHSMINASAQNSAVIFIPVSMYSDPVVKVCLPSIFVPLPMFQQCLPRATSVGEDHLPFQGQFFNTSYSGCR